MALEKKKIAIAGIGTVGKGLVKILEQFGSKLPNLMVSVIASRKRMKLPEKSIFKDTVILNDAKKLVNFDDYDILVELIGGDKGVAKDIVMNALKKKKHVVTANKALISKQWKNINYISKVNNCLIKYEAAVAGGVPIIKIIDEFLISNKISRIYGILNGTSNFILTKMLTTEKNFNEILKEAQKLGYAEADPTFDIDGIDTAHKLSILSSLAFNVDSELHRIKTEGIRNIDLLDLKFADSLGYKIKLLGISEIENRVIKNYVYPCLVEKDNFIANVDGVYNGVVVESDFCNKSFFQGEGAGSFPTATSVFSDIKSILDSEPSHLKRPKNNNVRFSKPEKRFGKYYLRFSTDDKPGVISGIAKEFKKNNISMKSMLQEDSKVIKSKDATIVITTHDCEEKDMIDALIRINKMSFIKKKTVYFRIENFLN
ncbi:MAG: homoserine dehydrogenase [Alphaproteobacteria bacterium]